MSHTLTPKELQVLQAAADGLLSKQIGQLLSKPTRTISLPRHNILTKLSVHTMAGAVAIGFRNGWIK